MGWKVNHDPSINIIEVKLDGEISAKEIKEALNKRIVLQKETGATGILVDVLELQSFPGSGPLFRLPSKLYEEVNSDRKSRIALLIPKFSRRAKLFETASTNRGWQVKTFRDRKSALEWLNGEKS